MTTYKKLLLGLGLVLSLQAQAWAEIPGSWSELDKLFATDGELADVLGDSVSVSGDRLLASSFADGLGLNAGAAYVFERDAEGLWFEAAKLVAADTETADFFSFSVSLDGDRALLSALYDDDNGSNAGAAYIFELGPNGWLEVFKIVPEDGEPGDNFGSSVSLDGGRAVIGAWDDEELGSRSGSAYVFERDPTGTWTQTTKLLASDAVESDVFGGAVSVQGDTVVVGAYGGDDLGSFSGKAYVFERGPGGSWAETAILTATDGGIDHDFGESVDLDLDLETLVVGAPGADGIVATAGAAYVFERGPLGVWIEIAKLTGSEGKEGEEFGESVAISGDRIVAGAARGNDFQGSEDAAYVFERSATGPWQEVARLVASDAGLSDEFGGSVAIDGDFIGVGACEADGVSYATGAAYVFEFLADGPELEVDGDCPGEIELSLSGGSPGGWFRIFGSDEPGTAILPRGPCHLDSLGLDDPEVLQRAAFDLSGAASTRAQIDEEQCGSYLQVVDETTCGSSEVLVLP